MVFACCLDILSDLLIIAASFLKPLRSILSTMTHGLNESIYLDIKGEEVSLFMHCIVASSVS